MFRNKLKTYTLLVTFSLGIFATSAALPKHSKSSKKKTKTHTSVAPSQVKLVQSSENVEMTTEEGNSVSLPRINQVLVEQSSALASRQENLLADASISTASLQKRLVEQKEMQELSSILGVSIKNPELLDLYREAADWLGTRYRRGGMTRKGVDCSGFTNIIYNNVFSKKLDRVSTVIAKNVKEVVAKEDLEPGDLVFFSTFGKKYINHVGVYLGEGHFVHASIKHGVIVSTLAEGYYSRTWRKGGRW